MRRTRTPVAAVQHGLMILVAVWQGLWLLSEWLTGSVSWGGVLATVGWGALVAAIPLSRPRGWLVVANIAFLTIAAMLLIFGDPADQSRGITATTVLAGSIGLLVPTRWALATIVGLSVLEFWVASTVPSPFISDVLAAAYAVAIGLGALLTRLALMRGASRALAMQQAAADQSVEARAIAQTATDLLATERIVHATVLNTLTALARGTASEPEVIRERAGQAADVLASLTAGGLIDEQAVPLVEGVERQAERLREAGLSVDVRWPKRDVALPSEVEAAIRGAVEEATTNVLRHARANHVSIQAVATPRGMRIQIDDDGVGISANTPHRIGLRDVIVAGMGQVGGSAEIASATGGTNITLSWERPHRLWSTDTNVQWILTRFVAPLILVFWSFTALRVALTWRDYEFQTFNALAFMLYTALVALTIWRSRSRPPDVVTSVAVLAGAPLVYQLQQLGSPTGDWSEWSSEAVAALFIVLAGAGAPWVWPAVIGVWLIMQGDVLTEILAPGFAILVAIGLFAISFRRNSSRSAEAQLQLIADQAQRAASEAVVSSIQSRARVAEVGNAIELLRDIESGSVDPRAEYVRECCAVEERLLRTAMRLDPMNFKLHAALGDIATASYQQGLILDVEVAETSAFDYGADAYRSVMNHVTRNASAGGVIRVTTQRTSSEWILLSVFEGDGFTDSVDVLDGMTVTHLPGEHMVLLEWRVPYATRDR